ncbi:MAG: NAD-dependent DNA ligase LigA, partial [Anaerolineaceae bacterium]|nr:NAD-dependent DNA ligase LigA [Anaerolineaceae bacterium]
MNQNSLFDSVPSDSNRTPEEEALFDEMHALRKELNYHSYRYHVLDSPVVSDLDYDRMMRRLEAIESQHPEWITADSPTQRIGAAPSEKFEKVAHPAPILSLASVTDTAGVRAWYERIARLDERVLGADFTIEPKIDGLTIVLHYRNGVLVQAASRGNGEIGEDITQNVRTIQSVPLRIPLQDDTPPVPPYLVVRGEAFITLKDFETLNQKLQEQGEKTYLNPRNTASGSLRQVDPGLTAARPLTWLCYAVIQADGEIPHTQWEILEHLRAWGFPVSDFSTRANDIDEVIRLCEERLPKRDELAFEADGIVIKLNDLVLADDLGIVGKDPRGALALKYPAREVTTRLNEI